MHFIQPFLDSQINHHTPSRIKLVTRLILVWHTWLRLYQLLNLSSTVFFCEKCTLLRILLSVYSILLEGICSILTQLFCFWKRPFNLNDKTNILNVTIEYILSTKRFKEPVFNPIQDGWGRQKGPPTSFFQTFGQILLKLRLWLLPS